MEWLFGDDESTSKVNIHSTDYTKVQALLTLPVADPFEKWTKTESDVTTCPNTLGFQDNRLRLLRK